MWEVMTLRGSELRNILGTHPQNLIFLFLITSMILAGRSFGADSAGFQVYVYAAKDGDCKTTDRVPAEAKLLFDGKEVAGLLWKDQTFLLNTDASNRLVTGSSKLGDDVPEDFVPRGKFAEAEGSSFVMVLDGKIVGSGLVAGMETLQRPPDCMLLYPAFPMVQGGKLAIAVGKPKSEVLGEEFFKVLVEEGPASCFLPGLDTSVKDYFQKQGRLREEVK